MNNDVLKVTGIDPQQKARLKALSQAAGAENVSALMRQVIDKLCWQTNLNFLIDDDLKKNSIETVSLLNRLIEIQNQNTVQLVTITKLLDDWLGHEFHGEAEDD